MGMLKPKQEQAIKALLVSSTILDAARRAGVHSETLHIWLKKPEFQAALEEQRRMLRRANVNYQALVTNIALEAAARDCASEDPVVRQKAWFKILDHALASRGLDIQGRLAREVAGDHERERPPDQAGTPNPEGPGAGLPGGPRAGSPAVPPDG